VIGSEAGPGDGQVTEHVLQLQRISNQDDPKAPWFELASGAVTHNKDGSLTCTDGSAIEFIMPLRMKQDTVIRDTLQHLLEDEIVDGSAEADPNDVETIKTSLADTVNFLANQFSEHNTAITGLESLNRALFGKMAEDYAFDKDLSGYPLITHQPEELLRWFKHAAPTHKQGQGQPSAPSPQESFYVPQDVLDSAATRKSAILMDREVPPEDSATFTLRQDPKTGHTDLSVGHYHIVPFGEGDDRWGVDGQHVYDTVEVGTYSEGSSPTIDQVNSSIRVAIASKLAKHEQAVDEGFDMATKRSLLRPAQVRMLSESDRRLSQGVHGHVV
jgi:hypothetical protein